jgi:hypothetical protein
VFEIAAFEMAAVKWPHTVGRQDLSGLDPKKTV